MVRKFIEFVVDKNDCFNVISHCNRRGYPKIGINGKQIHISHFIYTQCFGEIPKDMNIRHKCDNPLCINPDHLVIGTHKENMEDMVQRERYGYLKGEYNPNSKLLPRDILYIRTSELNNCQIAKIYNVTHQLISNIRLKKNWNHL